MTVAEMKRLEHAARLSLGGLPDTDMPSAATPKYIGRIIALALIVIGTLAIAMDLL